MHLNIFCSALQGNWPKIAGQAFLFRPLRGQIRKMLNKVSVLWYLIVMQASIRLNDILLVLVVVSSMAAAIIFPDFGSRFKALPFYCLMINFLLSYLSIDLASVWKALKGHSVQIFLFTVMKLAILPLIIYFVFSLFAPDYALSALLLTGVSAGVVAPMISNMVRGNSALVLVCGGDYFGARAFYAAGAHKDGCRKGGGYFLFGHAQDVSHRDFYSHYRC